MKFSLTYGTPAPEAALKVYGAGTNAVIDCFGGLIPCVVTEVVETGRGQFATEGKVKAEVSKTMAGYRKGEIVEMPASKIVPRQHVTRRTYSSSINTLYRWA